MGSVRRNSVKVTWRNVDSLTGKLHALPARVRSGVLKGLQAISLLLQNRARRGLQSGPKSGRIYKRRSVTHQASAPGEFPATDTGFLVRSVVGEVVKDTLEAVLSAGVLYAKWLELGTRFMRPRPFLVPTLEEVSKQAPEILSKAVKAELKDV